MTEKKEKTILECQVESDKKAEKEEERREKVIFGMKRMEKKAINLFLDSDINLLIPRRTITSFSQVPMPIHHTQPRQISYPNIE